MKDDMIPLTPETADQLRKDFKVTKQYLGKPQVTINISAENLTLLTTGIFSFLSFLIMFFLIAETIKSFNGKA